MAAPTQSTTITTRSHWTSHELQVRHTSQLICVFGCFVFAESVMRPEVSYFPASWPTVKSSSSATCSLVSGFIGSLPLGCFRLLDRSMDCRNNQRRDALPLFFAHASYSLFRGWNRPSPSTLPDLLDHTQRAVFLPTAQADQVES
jgi:hypothetical protein